MTLLETMYWTMTCFGFGISYTPCRSLVLSLVHVVSCPALRRLVDRPRYVPRAG